MNYNDNKSTVNDNGLESIHQYSMENNPKYRDQYLGDQWLKKFQANDAPLEDYSLDMIPLGLAASRGILGAFAGIKNYASGINSFAGKEMIDNLGRREAMKKGGVALGGVAAASSGIDFIMPKLAAKFGESAPISIKALDAAYKANKSFRQSLPGVTADGLVDISKIPSSFAKELAPIAKSFNKADDDMIKVLGIKTKNAEDVRYDVRDVYRFNDDTKKAVDYIKNTPEILEKYKHLGSPEEIEKSFRIAKDIELKKFTDRNDIYKIVQKSDDDLYVKKYSAIESDSPILSPKELNEQIVKQQTKLDKSIAKKLDQEKIIDSLPDTHVKLHGEYYPKDVASNIARYEELYAKTSRDNGGKLVGLTKEEFKEFDKLDNFMDYASDLSANTSVDVETLLDIAKRQKRIDSMNSQLNSLGVNGRYGSPKNMNNSEFDNSLYRALGSSDGVLDSSLNFELAKTLH